MSLHDECTGGEYPLAIGTMRGLRSWEYRAYSGKLHSVTYEYAWKPGDNLAFCALKRFGRCKREHCGCGFWAYHDGSEYPCGNVIGVIEAWGPTTIGTKGFRAESAKIVALCVNTLTLFDHERRLIRRMTLFSSIAVLNCVMLAVFGLWSVLVPLAGITGGVVVGTGAIYLLLRSTRSEMTSGNLTKADIELLTTRYPGVPIYSSKKKMLKDFPLTYKHGELDKELEEAA